MVSPAHKDSHTPICPKCGYDQSGEIATWQDQCPLDGRCPECGLDFEWANVLDPARVELSWYIEHAHSIWGMCKRTPGTLIRLVWPMIYWRSVGVEKPIRIKAIVHWLILFGAATHLFVSVVYGLGYSKSMSVLYGQSLGDLYTSYGWKGLSIPFVNAVGFPWVNLGINFQSNKVVVGSPALGGYGLSELLGPVALLFGVSLLWFMVILVIPTTRKQAKVRRAHVVRAGLMSVIAMILAYQCARLADGIDEWTRAGFSVNNRYQRIFGGLVMPALVIWVEAFWIWAVIIGWRVRPYKAVVFLGTVASLLGGVAVLYLVSMLIGWQ